MDNGAEYYRRFLDGDEVAFNNIMSEYRDILTYFIFRYVKNMDTAEDIAIDVFTYITIHRHKYNFKTSFKTYLFMLGRSRAIDYIRHEGVLNADSISENVISNEISPELAVISKEEKEKLALAVEELPENMKIAVYLVYFENLSYADTAKVLKKSVKQIDNLLYRARNLLREKLRNGGEFLL